MSLRCKYNDLCKTSYTKDKFDIKTHNFHIYSEIEAKNSARKLDI